MRDFTELFWDRHIVRTVGSRKVPKLLGKRGLNESMNRKKIDKFQPHTFNIQYIGCFGMIPAKLFPHWNEFWWGQHPSTVSQDTLQRWQGWKACMCGYRLVVKTSIPCVAQKETVTCIYCNEKNCLLAEIHQRPATKSLVQAFCHAKKNMNFKRIETYIRDVSNYLIGTYLKYLEIANTCSSFGSCQITLTMQKEGSERSPSKLVEIIFLLLQGLGMPQNIIVYMCIRPTRICMTCTIGIRYNKKTCIQYTYVSTCT